MLAEHAPGRHALVEDLGLDLVGAGPPPLGASSSPRSSARSAPRAAATQHITLDAVKCLGSPRTSQIPWSGSRQCSSAASTKPASPSHTGATIWPAAPVELDVDGVEDHAPHVVLLLVPGAVADPDRPRTPVAGEVVERLLGQVAFAADAVHDLQLERPVEVAAGDGVEDEAEVLDRLPVEAEAVQRAEHERRVADPGEPVVPVAFAAGRLRQGGGGGGHDGAGRGVAQRLEGQRTSVEIGLPRMVGNPGRAKPVAPEVDVVSGGLVAAARDLCLVPRQHHVGGLTFGEGGPAVARDPSTPNRMLPVRSSCTSASLAATVMAL